MAEERNKGSTRSEKTFKLTLEEVQRISSSTRKLGVSIVGASGSSSRNEMHSLKKVTSRSNTMCRDAKPIFDKIKKLSGTQDEAKSIASSVRRFILSLDDAVNLLRFFAQSTNRNESPISRAIFEKTSDHNIMIFFGSRDADNRKERNRSSSTNRAFNGTKWKKYRNTSKSTDLIGVIR